MAVFGCGTGIVLEPLSLSPVSKRLMRNDHRRRNRLDTLTFFFSFHVLIYLYIAYLYTSIFSLSLLLLLFLLLLLRFARVGPLIYSAVRSTLHASTPTRRGKDSRNGPGESSSDRYHLGEGQEEVKEGTKIYRD